MSTDPEDKFAEFPRDRPLTYEETVRFWEVAFADRREETWEEQLERVKFCPESERRERYDFLGSDEAHAEFLAFVYKLRHGEL